MWDVKQDQIDALKHTPKLRIQAEWTSDSYCHQNARGDITEVGVDGWLVRINGLKFPRAKWDDDRMGWDWSWRYTPNEGNTEAGKLKAIDHAMRDARLPWSQLQPA